MNRNLSYWTPCPLPSCHTPYSYFGSPWLLLSPPWDVSLPSVQQGRSETYPHREVDFYLERKGYTTRGELSHFRKYIFCTPTYYKRKIQEEGPNYLLIFPSCLGSVNPLFKGIQRNGLKLTFSTPNCTIHARSICESTSYRTGKWNPDGSGFISGSESNRHQKEVRRFVNRVVWNNHYQTLNWNFSSPMN